MKSRFRFKLLVLATLAIFPASLGAQDENDLQSQLEQAIRAAVQEVAPSVVRIETFGGLEKVGQVLVGTGPTTGLVVSEDGYVLSSAFNFVQLPSSILVTLPSGKRVSAEIVARDHARMLILLKVNSDEKLTVPSTVRREELKVGQAVIAVGRTYDKKTPNVSLGILSASNRIWGKAIQTDAKISPNNYGGPLVDLQGRVAGVLVPLSPQGEGEVAGAEWYDSGIGFAIPLNEIQSRLATLKSGEDLHPGLLGISLKGRDMYSGAVEIAALQPNSPAAKAGLKKGDTIIELEGVTIERQAQLRHQLGPRYAGDKLKLVAMRDKERIETIVELAAEIDPFEIPFLGILPVRDYAGEGAKLRYVYPESPAAEAGLLPGDVVTSFNGLAVTSHPQLHELVGTHDAKDQAKVELEFTRAGTKAKLTVALAKLPENIPGKLPPALEKRPTGDDEKPTVGLVDIKLPEERNNCVAYIPDDYDPGVPHGLVIWLHAPGKFDRGGIQRQWKENSRAHDLIVLAPQASDDDEWKPTEIDFVRKAADDVLQRYNIDRSRIVAHGFQGGGTMAYLVAFSHEDLVRGVAAVDAALPRGVRPPASDPIQRLAFYAAAASESPVAEQVESNVESLRELKFPVTVVDLGKEPRYLSAAELSDLARWVDSLDRI